MSVSRLEGGIRPPPLCREVSLTPPLETSHLSLGQGYNFGINLAEFHTQFLAKSQGFRPNLGLKYLTIPLFLTQPPIYNRLQWGALRALEAYENQWNAGVGKRNTQTEDRSH